MGREFEELRPSRSDKKLRYKPQDPSVDTFRQRFHPFEGIGDALEEWDRQRGTPIWPGTQERFGDPTKVISQLQVPPETTGGGPMVPPQGLQLPGAGQDQIGAAAGALPPPPVLDYIQRMLDARNRAQGIIPGRALGGKVDPNQPYVVGEKGPEVVVPDQPSTVVAANDLPPGFTRDPDGTIRGPAQAPGGLPPGYTKGPDGLIRGPAQQAAPQPQAQPPAQPSPLAGVPLSQDPAEQAREVAALRLGRQRPPEGKADVTGPADLVPGSVKAGFNQFLQDAGGKLQEPQNALPMALSGPVAPGIAAMRGGAALVRGMSESGIAAGDATATGKMLQGRITGATGPISQRLTTIADKPPEEAIAHMANMARTGSAEDLAALARMRQLTPVKSQPEVQAQLIQHLGKSDAGDFSATDFVRRYGELSNASKNILFGQGGTGSLKNHLDSIAEVSDRLWRGPSMKTMAKAAGGASAVGAFTGIGAVAAPIAVLGTMIPVKVLAHAMTSAPTTAAIAAWSRAYEKVVTSGTNAALTSFNIATRNLNNNLGTNVDPSTVLKGGASGQPVE